MLVIFSFLYSSENETRYAFWKITMWDENKKKDKVHNMNQTHVISQYYYKLQSHQHQFKNKFCISIFVINIVLLTLF